MAGRTIKIVTAFSWTITATILLYFFSLTLSQKVNRDRKVEEIKENNLAVFNQIQKGAQAIENGNQSDAIDIFEKILKQQPSNFDARFLLAETLSKECIEKDTLCDVALWQLSILIENHPNAIPVYKLRQSIYIHLGDSIGYDSDEKKIMELLLQ